MKRPSLSAETLLPTYPSRQPSAPTVESGRGLGIITAYARDYGTRPTPTGHGEIIRALMPPKL